jgi:hypothetical protein
MFCPVCRFEYKPGINRCPDCDVELVSSLPPEEDDEVEYDAPVPVFETSDTSVLLVAQSLLEADEIQYWTRSVGAGGVLMPEGSVTAGAGGASKLMVRSADLAEAREVLRELQEELKYHRTRRLNTDDDDDEGFGGDIDDDELDEDER